MSVPFTKRRLRDYLHREYMAADRGISAVPNGDQYLLRRMHWLTKRDTLAGIIGVLDERVIEDTQQPSDVQEKKQ